jgi:hypothetical protein
MPGPVTIHHGGVPKMCDVLSGTGVHTTGKQSKTIAIPADFGYSFHALHALSGLHPPSTHRAHRTSGYEMMRCGEAKKVSRQEISMQ